MPITTFNPPTLFKPRGFSHAVVATGGSTVYVSGQLASDLDGNLVGAGDYRAQAEQAMTNLNHALVGAGASPADLVRITILIVDHDPDKDALVQQGFRAAAQKIGGFRPVAALLIGCTSLALPGALVEIDGIAVMNPD